MTRVATAAALARLKGSDSLDPLVRALRDESANVRWKAAEALGEIGDAEAVPALLACLHDCHWWVRRSAAAALAQIGDPRALPALDQQQRQEHICRKRHIKRAIRALERQHPGERNR